MPTVENNPAAVQSNTPVAAPASAPASSSPAPAAAPAKKAPAKKKAPAAPKAAKKAPAKKAAPKKAAKGKPGAPKSEGLRKPQVRVLQALAKATKPLNRAAIASKAEVDVATLVEYIGSHDDAKRAANDKKHFPSLVTLKLVKFAAPEEGSGVVYEITAAGKAKVESLKNAAAK